MKRSLLPYGLISAALVLLASAPGAGPGDLTLFDAPRGAWLGTLRIDAPVEVLAEEDGWRRIRLEAWVPTGRSTISYVAQSSRGPHVLRSGHECRSAPKARLSPQ